MSDHRAEEIEAIEGMKFFRKKSTKDLSLLERVIMEIWHEIMRERVADLPSTALVRGHRGRVQLNSKAARGLEIGEV